MLAGAEYGPAARATGPRRDEAPRRQGRHREELRADPPLEPRGHGRPPAPVRSGPGRGVARPHGEGDLRDHRHREGPLHRKKKMTVTATDEGGRRPTFTATCRLDTPNEVDYYKNGGILHFVLRQLAAA